MKNDWTSWTAGILAGIVLFLSGCGEQKTEQNAVESPTAQNPAALQNLPDNQQETSAASPGVEAVQPEPAKQQKPGERG